MKTMIRLNKYISECGIASRRKADELIKQGRVTVNKKVVVSLSEKIDPSADTIFVDDVKLKREQKVYFLLYKPKGVITTTMDDKDRRTVVDLIKTKEKIFPVGRLDFNTTGVLLLTNDGEFSNNLTHPKNGIERVYVATLNRELSEKDKLKFLSGIFLDKRKSKFEDISFPHKQNFRKVKVTTVEGRNHFVKNMFSTLGYRVVELERPSFGEFNLAGMKPGTYKKLSYSDIKKILSV